MNDFFNKYFNIKKIFAEKRKYKQQMARVEALPDDYRYTFQKIQRHMWSYALGDGYDMLEVQLGIIDLFEESACNGKTVLEVTGTDVAGFVDELLKSTKTYMNNNAMKLNRDIARKLGSKTK